MAQTTIASPQVLTPAYNPTKYIVDSTNKNKNGFKYIFDIYESGTANKIGEYKVLPRINDGYGEERIEITAVGVERILARHIDTNKRIYGEHTWTLVCRCWGKA